MNTLGGMTHCSRLSLIMSGSVEFIVNKVEPLLLPIKRNQLRWSEHLIRVPPGWFSWRFSGILLGEYHKADPDLAGRIILYLSFLGWKYLALVLVIASLTTRLKNSQMRNFFEQLYVFTRFRQSFNLDLSESSKQQIYLYLIVLSKVIIRH